MERREFIEKAIDLYTQGGLHSFVDIYRVLMFMNAHIEGLGAEIVSLREEINSLQHILSSAVRNDK